MTPVVSAIAIHDAKGVLLFLAPSNYLPAGGEIARPLPAGFVEGAWSWDAKARTFVEDAAAVQAALLADVKAEAERRKMLVLSPGGAKKNEYDAKRAEVLYWDTLGGTVAAIVAAFNAMAAPARSLRFAEAIADAAAFGDTPADAIARFRAGLARSASVATINALEARACAAIKAATTIAAKRSAAVVTWPA